MRAAWPLLLLLLVALVSVTTGAGGENKKEKNKPSQPGAECIGWRYGNCVPSNGDCGRGFREGSCDQHHEKTRCKVPCNWKKPFGADCKYQFHNWGDCDPDSGLQTKTGILKRVMYNANCQWTISVFKPCDGKTKPRGPRFRNNRRGK